MTHEIEASVERMVEVCDVFLDEYNFDMEMVIRRTQFRTELESAYRAGQKAMPCYRELWCQWEGDTDLVIKCEDFTDEAFAAKACPSCRARKETP